MFDEVRLFVVKLLVVRAILLKVAKKVDEFRLVLQKNVYDGLRFIWIGHKHLRIKKNINKKKKDSYNDIQLGSIQ